MHRDACQPGRQGTTPWQSVGNDLHRPWLAPSTAHTGDLAPPKIRSMKETFGGHWQRLDLGTPAITWLTCWPQPDHVALPHLRQVTCRHIWAFLLEV
jgi:hypothetical protein